MLPKNLEQEISSNLVKSGTKVQNRNEFFSRFSLDKDLRRNADDKECNSKKKKKKRERKERHKGSGRKRDNLKARKKTPPLHFSPRPKGGREALTKA